MGAIRRIIRRVVRAVAPALKVAIGAGATWLSGVFPAAAPLISKAATALNGFVDSKLAPFLNKVFSPKMALASAAGAGVFAGLAARAAEQDNTRNLLQHMDRATGGLKTNISPAELNNVIQITAFSQGQLLAPPQHRQHHFAC